MKSKEQLIKELKSLYIQQSELLEKHDIESVQKYKSNRLQIGFLEDVLELNVIRM